MEAKCSNYKLIFLITCRKIKCRIWNQPTEHLPHSINVDIHSQIDITLIKFIFTLVLKHTNYICRMLVHCKLLFKNPVSANNYYHISVKYDLYKREWYSDVVHLLGKILFYFKHYYTVI